MRPGSLALLGVAAYSAFLVATMPARWLAERLLPPGPGRIAVQEVEGTIWQGAARAAIGGYAGTFTIDRIEWSFLPSRLLQGRWAYGVTVRGAGFDARSELGRSFGGWALRDLAARADSAVATALLPWTRPWRPEGSLTAASKALDIDGQDARGELRIEWTGAATALSELKPLGTYRADAIAEGPAARVTVSTLTGPLRVSGQGRLAFPSQFTFSGEARGEGTGATALEPLLDLLGPRRPDGARAIEWRAR
jgi:general secretion pathway protein N